LAFGLLYRSRVPIMEQDGRSWQRGGERLIQIPKTPEYLPRVACAPKSLKVLEALLGRIRRMVTFRRHVATGCALARGTRPAEDRRETAHHGPALVICWLV
jgi:hypothetical protein